MAIFSRGKKKENVFLKCWLDLAMFLAMHGFRSKPSTFECRNNFKCLKSKKTLWNPYFLLVCTHHVLLGLQDCNILFIGVKKPFYSHQRISSECSPFVKGHPGLNGGPTPFRGGCLCHLHVVKFSFPVVCSLLKCKVTRPKWLKFFY